MENFESKNSRNTTPKPNGNPITGEGYNDRVKYGKKVVKNETTDMNNRKNL